MWEAFLQRVRIRGRREVKLCQPSLAVDVLWQQLEADNGTWSHLPEYVQVLTQEVRGHHSRSNLKETHQQAYWDEFATRLPMIFLVDENLAIADAPPVSGRLHRR